MNRPIRISLIVLNSFLALTSIAGGLGLLLGINAPPIELLNNSPFTSYLFPGSALLILVGGTASFAAIMLIRHHRHALFVTFMAAVSIIIFEVVEVIIIGSPQGIARDLQIFYFAIGIALGVVSLGSRRYKGQASSLKGENH